MELLVLSVMAVCTWGIWSIFNALEYKDEMSKWNLFYWITTVIVFVVFTPIFAYQKLVSFKPKSEEQKEIKKQRRELEQLIKYRDYQKELSNINQEREAVLRDIERLDETTERRYEKLFEEARTPSEIRFLKGESYCAICDKWYQGERCSQHVKSQYAVDPSKFMKVQSTKEAGEEHAKAIDPEDSLTSHCPCGGRRIAVKRIDRNDIVTIKFKCIKCGHASDYVYEGAPLDGYK